ncbi:single-stranded DNA-binding protein, partial [Enterococcus faecalis]|uniref:single-stranded DNA-binding protein n=1 Tax=Enterococcus faecalis TaxID=1351 RepID=UPI003CC5FF0E
NCFFGVNANLLIKILQKNGTLIGLTGRIQTRNNENQQGQRIYVTEVVTESFHLLESREVNEQRKEQATGKATFDIQSMDKP